MDVILGLLDPDHDQPRDADSEVSASRLHQASAAALAALGIGGLWGAAVGSVSAHLAAANLYKVPMVMLLSALSALPAGVLAWRALGASARVTPFLAAMARGLFAGALVLGASAPLVALYSHTSSHAGPLIAVGSVAAALVTAVAIFARAALAGATESERPRRIAAVALCAGLQLAAALQLNVLAAPILPSGTVFSGGIDGVGAALHF